MSALVRFLLVLLSVATGAVFIYSAYTKAFPIYSFEATLVEYAHFPALLAGIASRIFVSLEAAMGLLILLNIYGWRKWVLWFTIALLMVFNIYLIYLWVVYGSAVNCGCFGDAIWMNAPMSLLKNAFLLAALGTLVKYHRGITLKWTPIVYISVPLSLLICSFIAFPLFQDAGAKPDITSWYSGKAVTIVPSVDLRKGKHVLAFLSPSCSHCMKAAKKMHDIHLQYPNTSFFMVIGGTESKLDSFWKHSEAEDLPYTRMEKEAFLKNTGGVFPRIVLLKNGTIVAHTGYKELNAETLNNWMKN